MDREILKETLVKTLKSLHLFDKPYLKTHDVANALGISKSQVNNLVKTQKLNPFKHSPAYNSPHLFHINDIINFYVNNTIFPNH
jgi:hypothetical protein